MIFKANLYSKIINIKFDQKFVFFHLRHHAEIELILRALRAENQTKVQHSYLHFDKKWQPERIYNAMHNDQLKPVGIPLSAVK